MTFNPMLAKSCNPKEIPQYIQDNDWVAQQKLDGIRILITAEDGDVSGVGRSGRSVSLPDEAITPFKPLTGLWRFDGEFVTTSEGEGVLWLFDLPNAVDGLIDNDTPYWKRAECLGITYDHLFPNGSEDIKLLAVHETPKGKAHLLEWCEKNDAEGVMFKHRNSKYYPGVRSVETLKAKFTETVDVVILEVGREGKESCSVGAFHNGTLTDIGSVKMTASQGLGKAKAGNVIEVRYLNAGKNPSTPRLYQPVFMKFRDDKSALECNTDQLKFVNKTVRKV